MTDAQDQSGNGGGQVPQPGGAPPSQSGAPTGYPPPQTGAPAGYPQTGAPAGYPQTGAPTYPQTGPPAGYPPPPASGYASAPPPSAGYGYGQPGAIAPGMWYDQASGLQLPNGVELASVGRRIGAYFLSIPLAIVTLGIGYLIWGLIVWRKGTSPALSVLGMKVWKPAENRVASWGTMALRDIIGRIVDGILSIITELISFIMFVTGNQRQSLHDKVAGTVVLYDPNKVLG